MYTVRDDDHQQRRQVAVNTWCYITYRCYELFERTDKGLDVRVLKWETQPVRSSRRITVYASS